MAAKFRDRPCWHGTHCGKQGIDCGPALPRPRRSGCSATGCPRDHAAHGYCDAHLKRWLRTGDPMADKPIRGYA